MKKPIYKKWWFWVIIVVVVIAIAAAGGGSSEEGGADAGKEQQTQEGAAGGDIAENEEADNGGDTTENEEADNDVDMTENEEADNGEDTAALEETDNGEGDVASEENETKYTDGMYKVGSDIPAGEYVVFADGILGIGYMEVAKDSSGELDSIIANANIEGNDIITISDGQYFKLQGAYAIPFEEAELDTTKEGTFKVGTHIPAGEYKIVLDEDNALEMGYIEAATDSSGSLNSIRTNDNITGDTYITVNDGEYLTLTGCHIAE